MNYSFFPTLLNDFKNYQLQKTYGAGDFILCTEEKLLDKLNRKPYEVSEPMKKGTAFEELVMQPSGYEGGGWAFKKSVVDEVRAYCKGGIWQQFVQFSIPVNGHRVKLYGYIDVVKYFRTIDVKTGKQYDFPYFEDGFQHHVYLMGCRAENIMVEEHMYIITDFEEVYMEPYKYDHEQMLWQLQVVCADLIDFIDLRRDLITSEKSQKMFT